VVRFCPRCGARIGGHAANVLARELADRDRAVTAVSIVVVAVLAGVVAAYFVGDAGGLVEILAMEGLAAVGVLIALRVSRERVADAFPYGSASRDVLWAPVAAACSLAAAFAYMELLDSLGLAESGEEEALSTLEWLAIVVVAPIAEEAVCRGVLFSLLGRLVTPRSVLLLSAALFAFFHGLNGGLVLEYPHRFVGGLAFGYLRLRTGSLTAPTLAHGLHNLVAVTV
jgi:membrane protease YdiL (CAAX protease family)